MVIRNHKCHAHHISSLHAVYFCDFLFLYRLFISKLTFSKDSFSNTISVSNSSDSDKARRLSGLIWVRTVFKDQQQTTKFGYLFSQDYRTCKF